MYQLASGFWTLSIVIVFFSKPLHFERCLFPHPQVKHTLLDLLDRVSLYQCTLSTEHAGLYIPAVRRSVCVLQCEGCIYLTILDSLLIQK
jgi:hypothetical protein